MNVTQVADYVLRRAAESNASVTNLKLQKILYYVQGYSLRALSAPAFEEEIYHWQYGPVCPIAYFSYSIYRAAPLSPNYNQAAPRLSRREKQLYDRVIDACLEFSARELVDKTHEEAPWRETNDRGIISKDMITQFFCRNNPLGIGEVP